MNLPLWIVVGVVAASFGVTTGFFMVATARRIEEAGIKLRGPRRLIVRCWYYVGAISDAVYNVSVGTLRFREWPLELMYSGRVQRLVDHGTGWRLAKAIAEARMLNAAWAEHIRNVPE